MTELGYFQSLARDVKSGMQFMLFEKKYVVIYAEPNAYDETVIRFVAMGTYVGKDNSRAMVLIVHSDLVIELSNPD